MSAEPLRKTINRWRRELRQAGVEEDIFGAGYYQGLLIGTSNAAAMLGHRDVEHNARASAMVCDEHTNERKRLLENTIDHWEKMLRQGACSADAEKQIKEWLFGISFAALLLDHEDIRRAADSARDGHAPIPQRHQPISDRAEEA